MRKIERWILFLLLLAVMIEVVFLAPKQLEDAQKKTSAAQAGGDHKADQAMQGVHLIETGEGRKEWELWADAALGYKGQGNWKLQKVKVIFFSEGGLEFTVTGDRGDLVAESKNMLIEGNVVTTTSNDYRFESESVLYRAQERWLQTPHPVAITSPQDAEGYRMKLRGVGMNADLNNSKIVIPQDVQGEKNLGRNRNLEIKSREVTLSGVSKSALFKGDVVMNVDTMTVTGPEAYFKYGTSEQVLRAIEVRGGVRASDVEKWATSRSLDILLPEDQFVFQGEPRVVQNNDEIQGDKIIFLNGGKQVRVQSGNASLTEKPPESEL